jgi:predicted nucleotidyltransferase
MPRKIQIEEMIAAYFKENSSGTIAVYVFGSHVSGKSSPASDVDIAILFDRCDPVFIHSRLFEILVQMPRLLRKDVHPVAMNSAGEALLKQILGKGQCLVVNDSRKLAEFKMLAYARIAGFTYYQKKMQAGLIRRVLEAAPHG